MCSFHPHLNQIQLNPKVHRLPFAAMLMQLNWYILDQEDPVFQLGGLRLFLDCTTCVLWQNMRREIYEKGLDQVRSHAQAYVFPRTCPYLQGHMLSGR